MYGVTVANLIDKNERQISLFENNINEKQNNIDKVMDTIKEKYGSGAIGRAGKLNVDNIVKLKK